MSTSNLDGRFTVKGPLRCAGVGSLMCAEDKKDGARTAIRLIPNLAQGERAVAAALKMPLHPVLPRTLGSGAEDGSAWVAIDFPEGELLTHRIPLETPSLLTMASMIAGALAALHQNNIIHGELSGESVLTVPMPGGDRFVLFDAPLVVMNRLTDRRGEERLLAQLTHLVPFLSPERARGAEATQESDVWSLGMIISLASGAKGIPGDSTLEKIAAIVTNKWRPTVSQSLPIALRLLLTRMLAPEPRDRPSSLDVAIELENLCVSLAAHQQVTPHAAPLVDTLPVPQFRMDKLVEQAKSAPDPFEQLVAQGVSALGPDAHAEPTRRMGFALTADLQQPVASAPDVTDPNAIQVPVPTAPSVPVWVEPASAQVVTLEGSASPLPLIIPAHPSQQPQRRTPTLPLPPILDPNAIVVAPQPGRHHSPSPMPRVDAQAISGPHQQYAQTETMRFGALPGAVRPAKVPAVLTEDVAEEAAAARAQAQAETISAAPPSMPMPVPEASMPTAHMPSVHDEAEEAFAANVQKAQKRRYMAAAIAAGIVILLVGGLTLKSALEGPPEEERVRVPRQRKVASAEKVEKPKSEAAVKAAPAPKAEPVVKAEPAPQAEPAAKAEPVVRAEPAPKAEPVVKAEPKPAPAPKAEPVVAKAEPAPKAEPVVKAEPKPAPAPKARAEKPEPLKVPEAAKDPVVARPAPAPKPAKVTKKAADEAPRRPASRLDEGD